MQFRSIVAGMALLALVGVAAPAVAAAAPDLQPTPSYIARGVVSVRNTGAAAAPASIVTVRCHRPGLDTDRAILENLSPAYSNPDYPGLIVVRVPALAPGGVFNHSLAGWSSITWPSGATYHFDVVVDADDDVDEGSAGERNNTGTYVFTAR